jgi:hypothetical protein
MNQKVYTAFQINLIVFVFSAIMFVPIVSVFAFIFDLQNYIDPVTIILIALVVLAVIVGVGVTFIIITRDTYQRRLKPIYQKEFSFLLLVGAMGVLGSGIIFTYLGGPAFYVPHVIIPLFLIVFTLLIVLGRKFFNVNLIRK